MQSLEYITDPAEALTAATDFSPQLQGHDFQESDEFGSHPEGHAEAPPSTDDPVRVYLREMGSVRLLNRQGEIELAKRMERGRLRMRKPLSRSPLVWQTVLALSEGVRDGTVRLADFVELGGADRGRAGQIASEGHATTREICACAQRSFGSGAPDCVYTEAIRKRPSKADRQDPAIEDHVFAGASQNRLSCAPVEAISGCGGASRRRNRQPREGTEPAAA